MNYKKRIIKHFSTLQMYIRQAATTSSFPTVKQMTKIQNEIAKGKTLIREMPIYHSRSTHIRQVSLDALFRIRRGQSIFVSAQPDIVRRWCKRNNLTVEIVILHVDVKTRNKRMSIPKKLLMIKLLDRVEDEFELSEHIGDSQGESGEVSTALQSSTS